MERFDRELRGSPEWIGWEQKEAHQYAIQYAGRLYPVKKIVSLATSTPVGSFSGGDEPNAYVTSHAFEVILLRESSKGQASIQVLLERILSDYLPARGAGGFGKSHPIWQAFAKLETAVEKLPAVRDRHTLRVDWSIGKGNWAGVPWLAIIDSKESEAPRGGIYCVLLFREDMTGVYMTLIQGVEKAKKDMGLSHARLYFKERAARIRSKISFLLESDYLLDERIDLGSDGLRADSYEDGTIAYKFYKAGSIPQDVDISKDIAALLRAYSVALEEKHEEADRNLRQQEPAYDAFTADRAETLEGADVVRRGGSTLEAQFDRSSALQELIQAIEASGFVFEPWQVAAYVTALRTKPFVILAGVSGTGKSKLPSIVARLTGSHCDLIPVRPDWTDSSDVLGYVDLQGVLRPGLLLKTARAAKNRPDQYSTLIVDEMNLARVEQYFAEVLSRVEDRQINSEGKPHPLLTIHLRPEDREWAELGLPSNLGIVGTVNMDETTHGFSRKVLDRAFTIELSDTDLSRWTIASPEPACSVWPLAAWRPRSVSLAQLRDLTSDDITKIQEVIGVLTNINGYLQQSQLQVGYRTRDEVSLFALHAGDVASAFRCRDGSPVDPLDLAIHMKILPRLVGGSSGVRRSVQQLLGWAKSGRPLSSDEEAQTVIDEWIDLGRPGAFVGSLFPRTAGRLCIMWERFLSEGYTSYWL